MDSFMNFLYAHQLVGPLVGIVIFILTIFLAAKKWIGASLTFLLLLFALFSAFLINNQKTIESYLKPTSTEKAAATISSFEEQVHQALKDIKSEIQSEKKNLTQVVVQVQDLFKAIETEKEKLDHFIQETKEHFKKDRAEKQVSNYEDPT
jgi:flagellar motility protein MotE (MotC chaperone)